METNDMIFKSDIFSNPSNLSKNDFNFISQIGSGSFGKVYKVKRITTNEIYALKVLSRNQLTKLKLIDQLKNEISILGSCKHENIIKLYCVFEEKGYIFMIMELANNDSLFNKLKKSRTFNEKQTALYMLDIIKAIVYLHSKDPPIIHRDLKPENVLICDDILKIADFGWSNYDDDIRNTFCGTPDYLSPEMILGTGHNEKLDVWGLGVLMYELIHGKPPFSPKNKIRDRRLLQKTIEENILKGRVNFDPKLSTLARSAIKIMLHPNQSIRPFAKDLVNLDFFKQYLTISKNKNFKISNNNNLKKTDLGKRVENLEKELKNQRQENQNLLKMMQMKDQNIKKKDIEVNLFKEKLTEFNQKYGLLYKTNETISSKNIELKKNLKELKSFNKNSSSNKKLEDNLRQQEETVSYLFKKTKDLSKIISDFYGKCYKEEKVPDLENINILSFEDTIKKLEKIFLLLENNQNKNKETIPFKFRTNELKKNEVNLLNQKVSIKAHSKQEIPVNKLDKIPHVTFKNYISNQEIKSGNNLNSLFVKSPKFFKNN